ncbi:hypothetical protein J6590_094733 [Homalodisca vitripennis]|nr:hypothetical protein J6590_094733 [Homalodisca vitripennis]
MRCPGAEPGSKRMRIKTNKPLTNAPARLLLPSPDLAEMCPDVSRVWCLLLRDMVIYIPSSVNIDTYMMNF